MYLVDSNKATTTSHLVDAACVRQGGYGNAKEAEKKLAVEEEEAGDGHEPHS